MSFSMLGPDPSILVHCKLVTGIWYAQMRHDTHPSIMPELGKPGPGQDSILIAQPIFEAAILCCRHPSLG
jgi:hypothetical protein